MIFNTQFSLCDVSGLFEREKLTETHNVEKFVSTCYEIEIFYVIFWINKLNNKKKNVASVSKSFNLYKFYVRKYQFI